MASHMPDNYNETRLHRYLAHWNRDKNNLASVDVEAISWPTEEERRERMKNYDQVASDYYDLVSPLYEQGWGQQFHYSPLQPGLSLAESTTAYEKVFAELARVKEGMRVLDLGCGIGGPARTIASTYNCKVVGITNSAWHVERGTALTKKAGLDHLVSFVKGDFVKLPFPDNSFDAAYSVESLCYAPVPVEVYREVKRVLKPGAPFTFHDFAMTEKWDPTIPEHVKVRNWIEFGNGLSKMHWVPDMRKALKEAGFILHREIDMALTSSPAPWYYGPAGDICWAWRTPGWADFWKVFKMWPPFRGTAHLVYKIMILFGMVPKEVSGLMDMMWYCSKATALGGKMGIFTPMYAFVCEKPRRENGVSPSN